MKLLRLLLATVTATLGLVVFTQLPASACDCAAGGPVQAAAPAPTRSAVLPAETPSKPPVPTNVPSGVERLDRVDAEGAPPPWAWFGAGVLLALVGGFVRVSRGSWRRQA